LREERGSHRGGALFERIGDAELGGGVDGEGRPVGVDHLAQTLVAKKLAAVGFTLYAAESYLERHGFPRKDAGLAGHLVCAYGGEIAQIEPAKWLADLEEKGAGRVVLSTGSMLGLTRSIAAGVGVGVLPCFLGDAEPTLRRVIEEPIGKTEVWLVVHPDMARVSRVRAVIDFLVEAISLHERALTGVS